MSHRYNERWPIIKWKIVWRLTIENLKAKDQELEQEFAIASTPLATTKVGQKAWRFKWSVLCKGWNLVIARNVLTTTRFWHEKKYRFSLKELVTSYFKPFVIFSTQKFRFMIFSLLLSLFLSSPSIVILDFHVLLDQIMIRRR